METTSHDLQHFEAYNVRDSLMLLEGNLCRSKNFGTIRLKELQAMPVNLQTTCIHICENI